jgi:predicted 2-oxoglutarate/Fe(II)-dependent dioxygenase YbiX
MGPGHRTSLHTHDEHDELLSAVYYVTAPQDSGDLVIEDTPVTIRVRPEAGLMVLFPPDAPHAVEENASDRDRLSVAFNFGPA